MPRRKAVERPISPRRPPAKTPEGRENQMISMAVDLAEEQLRNGTASSQVIVHFLKLASSREKLEQEKLRQENEMLKAKTKAYGDSEDMKRLMEEALNAMRSYSGGYAGENNNDTND